MRGLTSPLARDTAVAARDAAVVVALSAAVALGFNALRDGGLPLVADEPYAILVPCPEPGGEVGLLAPADVGWADPAELVVDARDADAAAAWALPAGVRARVERVPYDFLEPVDADDLARLLATPARRVVVFGDGARADSGHELGRELSGSGLRNVMVVEGGAPAVRAHLEGVTP